MADASVTVTDFREFAESLGENGTIVSGETAFLVQLVKLKEVAANNDLTEARKYESYADKFSSEYQ